MAHRCMKVAGIVFQPSMRSFAFAPAVNRMRPTKLPAVWRSQTTALDGQKPPTQILQPIDAKGNELTHFRISSHKHPLGVQKLHDVYGEGYKCNPVPHPIWSQEDLQKVKETHLNPGGIADTIAYLGVKVARFGFDTLSLYKFGKLTPTKVLNRAIFLETVAGVPGMCAGMHRHLRSLRRMDRDHGWIHTLLEEAENERMHLMTFLQLKKPGMLFRTLVLAAQGIFMPAFFIAYLINPHICHRFVGYLEEEAVHTYQGIIDAIDDGRLGAWKTEPAPLMAIDYWKMAPDATMRDLILAVRADEANHRDVNHTFASLELDQDVPFAEDGRFVHQPGELQAQQQYVASAGHAK